MKRQVYIVNFNTMARKKIGKAKAIPQANEDGFIQRKGERHGTLEAWAQELKLERDDIEAMLVGGEDPDAAPKKRRLAKFLGESRVREACGDLLKGDLPQADEDGFIEIDDEKHGTVGAWSKKLNDQE